MNDLAGRVIKSYELKELIGEGGFGAVYRAHQQFIGREVAIKIILPQHANRPDFIRRFETEAQLVARLEHPHIVPLYDYWREPSGAYLVMRWLRGGSVQDLLDRDGAIPAARASSLMNQICEALAVAHRQGVIHRDLKPENIMLDENGNAYLSDFGIAKDLGNEVSITQNNAIVGSPAYLSPEQIKGDNLTLQSDIYALGIVLFQMLTGLRPFRDATPATLMYKHLSEPVPDISTMQSDLPEAVNAVIQRATAKDPTMRYADTIELAREFRRSIKQDPDAPGTVISTNVVTSTGNIMLPEPENPYKGLRAFQQADAPDFFGRDRLTNSIIDRLKEDTDGARFLAVVGPSGSGKSSVVKAGVLPALRRGELPGSEDWFVVEMVPGIDPLEELEAALLRIAVNPPESLLNQLREDDRGLLRAIKRVLPDDGSELILLVDQFEELFTLVDDEAVRTHFLNSIRIATAELRSRIRVIVTLRADFYGGPLQYTGFGELMRARTEVVLPLNTEELEAAITGPAERVGMQLDQGLVTALVTSVNEQPGTLPLLQYALTELFERRDGHTLTLEAYNAIGGTMGALARRADELYDGLGEEGEEAAKQMFLRLVTLGEGTEDTRRRTLQTELLTIGDDPETMELVIDAFGRYRLLTFDHDPQSRSATVEVAHEALIRQWSRLRNWLDENRDDLRTQRRLAAAADEWHQANQDPSFLARGARLEQFVTWQETTALSLNDEEAQYLDASVKAREAQLAAERARQEREEALERRSRNFLRMLVAVMTVATIISIGLAVVAISERQDAQDARAEAEDSAVAARNSAAQASSLALAANSRNAANEHDTSLALVLAMEANRAYDPSSVEVTRILATTAYGLGVQARFQAHTGAVLAVAFSPDSQLTASGASDGDIRIWDNYTGEETSVVSLGDVIITDLSFSPDGNRIAAAATDNKIYVIDLETGETTLELEGHEHQVSSVEYTQDGQRLVSGSLDKTVRIWDAETGELMQTLEGHLGTIFEVSASADGQIIASSSGDENIEDIGDDLKDRTVRIWDAETGEELYRLSPPTGYIRTVDISPDGSLLATASWNSTLGGVVTLWDTLTGREVTRLFGHSNVISKVTFGPDGTRLFSTSWDGTLRIWDVEKGIEINQLQAFEDRPLSLDLSPDGQFAAVGTGNIGGNEITPERENSADTSVWLIDLQNRALITEYVGHEDWVWSVDISPNGDIAVSGAGSLNPPANDTRLIIWDVATGEPLHYLEGHTGTVEGLAFGPSGDVIASGGWDSQVILWDTEGNLLQHLDGHEGEVKAVVFNDTQTILASGDSDGVIILWNPDTGEQIRRIEAHDGAVSGLAFSANGVNLASGAWDNSVKIWDVETGALTQTLEGHTGWINDVAFHPDKTRVLSGSWDETIRLWDIETGEELRRLVGHSGPVQGIDISDDGHFALSGAGDTTVRLWDLDTAQEIFRYDGHRDWVSEVVFTPDGYALSSAQDDTLRLWQVPSHPDDVVAWINEHRYVRELTCAERDRYRVEPLCTQ